VVEKRIVLVVERALPDFDVSARHWAILADLEAGQRVDRAGIELAARDYRTTSRRVTLCSAPAIRTR